MHMLSCNAELDEMVYMLTNEVETFRVSFSFVAIAFCTFSMNLYKYALRTNATLLLVIHNLLHLMCSQNRRRPD